MHDDEINLIEYWNIIWKRKMLIILLFLISVTTALIVGKSSDKYYKADTLILTTSSDAGGLGAALSSLPLAGMLGATTGLQTQTDKIMVVLKSRTIAEAIIDRFDLIKIFNIKSWDQARGTWKDPNNPPLIEDVVGTLSGITEIKKSKEGSIRILVESKDPKLSSEIANYYVTALTNYLKDKSMNITIQVVDHAVPPARKSRPKIRQSMMIAGMASVLIGFLLALFLENIQKNKRNT